MNKDSRQNLVTMLVVISWFIIIGTIAYIFV